MNKITIDCMTLAREGPYGGMSHEPYYRIRMNGLTENDCEYVRSNPSRTLRKRLKRAIKDLELRLNILKEFQS